MVFCEQNQCKTETLLKLLCWTFFLFIYFVFGFCAPCHIQIYARQLCSNRINGLIEKLDLSDKVCDKNQHSIINDIQEQNFASFGSSWFTHSTCILAKSICKDAFQMLLLGSTSNWKHSYSHFRTLDSDRYPCLFRRKLVIYNFRKLLSYCRSDAFIWSNYVQ